MSEQTIFEIYFIKKGHWSNFYFSLKPFCASNILYLEIKLSEITTMIKGKLISSNTSPFFILKYLGKMSRENKIPCGTRFCCQKFWCNKVIFNQVLGLRKQKKGKMLCWNWIRISVKRYIYQRMKYYMQLT